MKFMHGYHRLFNEWNYEWEWTGAHGMFRRSHGGPTKNISALCLHLDTEEFLLVRY